MSAAAPAPGWQEAFRAAAAARASSPVAPLADASFQRFLAKGFPTTREEDWKYTSVASVARTAYGAPPAARLAPALAGDVLLPDLGGARMVFVNGHFAPEHSSAGAGLAPLSQALAADPAARARFGAIVTPRASAFTDLNTALFADGACLVVPRGRDAGTVHVIHVVTGEGALPVAAHPRLLVLLGENASASVIETHVGAGEGLLANCVTEIELADGARLEHVHVQRQPLSATHVASTAARLGRSATLESVVVSLGAGLSRHDLSIELAGEGASCVMDGLWLVSGAQHCDHHTLVDHAVPHTSSQQLYKGVHAGSSRGVFNGKVIVRQGAQATTAHQQNRNLLLSRDALVDTKPELQIHADDVRCTHGATIGQIDDDQLFYLRARGIGEADARALLTLAFADEIVDRIKVPALREVLLAEIARAHAALGGLA